MNKIVEKMASKPITLFDILKLMIDRHWPAEIDGENVNILSPLDSDKITICFTDDEDTWLTCDAQNAILVPWYDCEVYGLDVYADRGSICVWMAYEHFLKEKYADWLWERTNKI